MIVSASTPPLTTKHHRSNHAKPRGVATNGSVAIHHDTHEKEVPQTAAQRIAALGSGVLLTTAVNLWVNAENKLPPSAQPKSAALLSTDVGSWVKSLGLLAGVQGINAGLGLQLPPVINALELGAVSHVLIPGTTGSRVAHFMTMAPLLVGSVGVTQAAHAVIDHTVDSDSGLSKKEQQVTKSLLGFVVSIGMGVAAMALFPRIHIGLSGLGVKFQSNKATGAKALENWYITTTKTVDGWQHATGKAWEQVQTKLQNRWERTWKKSAERPPLNKETWFDKKAFIKNVEVPWADKAFYTEKPEDKLYTLQKSHSQTLAILAEPYTWQEHAMQWLTGKQSPVARAMLATKWGTDGKPVPSPQFLKGGEFEQFQAKYEADIQHTMVDHILSIKKNATEIATFLDGNEGVIFSEDEKLNQHFLTLIAHINDPIHQFQQQNLAADFKLLQQSLLPLVKSIEKIALTFPEVEIKKSNNLLQNAGLLTASPAINLAPHEKHRLFPVLKETLTNKIIDFRKTGKVLRELLTLCQKVEFSESHIPAVSSFWAMTGAAAGAVTCGSGCCAGSFFCLNEATALFGSLFGALVTKLGWNQSKEESEKKKKKVKV